VYTQCPDCGTVFRVMAESLRAARGQVRCGICSVAFNALDSLREQPAAELNGPIGGDDTITVEELPGTEFIELSDGEAAEATEPPPVPFIRLGDRTDAAPGARGSPPEGGSARETAGLDAGDEAGSAVDDDTALEFRGTVEDLERLFVSIDSPTTAPVPSSLELEDRGGGQVVDFRRAMERIASSDLSGIEVAEGEGEWPGDRAELDGNEDEIAAPNPAQIAAVLAIRRPPQEPSAGSPAPKTGELPTSVEERELDELDRTDEFPILVLDEQDELKVLFDEDGRRDATLGDESDQASQTDGVPDDSRASPPRDQAAAGQEEETFQAFDGPGIPIPEELRRDTALAADEIFAARLAPETDEGPPRWPWILALAALVLLAGAQAVHHWREDLVREPLVGPWLMQAYALLGLPLAPPADLRAFELRQLGAASDASRSGRLKLRASIVNGAAFAQPFPLLRLSLQDRFGTTIGTRDLEPAEYLPGGEVPASGLMAAGQRADAELVFVDPGRDAVGFELDVCLREGGAVRCSADPPTERP
jgi:predicted Zn finger-like uncharacterized protein/MYXO-CTERM domain-containing protein